MNDKTYGRGGSFAWERICAFILAATVLLLIGQGCSLLQFKRSESRVEMGSLQSLTNASGKVVSAVVLQAQVKRFADEYSSMVAQAADDYAAAVNTPDARMTALKWKLGQATAAIVDATGISPVLNAVDLLMLATLSRMVVEDTVVKQ
ncbi:MAG TPA: hypothetical protein PKA41_19090, partial [Verrucomicrobiota bacterium]|nr:hypothetical protein [Verrucomicrobiota bacterium]